MYIIDTFCFARHHVGRPDPSMTVARTERVRRVGFFSDHEGRHGVGDLGCDFGIETVVAAPVFHACAFAEVFSEVVCTLLPAGEYNFWGPWLWGAEAATGSDGRWCDLPVFHPGAKLDVMSQPQMLTKMVFAVEGAMFDLVLAAFVVVVCV